MSNNYIIALLFLMLFPIRIYAQEHTGNIDLYHVGVCEKPLPELIITCGLQENISISDIMKFINRVYVSQTTYSYLREYINLHKQTIHDLTQREKCLNGYGTYAIIVNGDYCAVLDQKETSIYLKKMENILRSNDKLNIVDVENVCNNLDEIIYKFEPRDRLQTK